MITLRLGRSVVAAFFLVAAVPLFVASAFVAIYLQIWQAGVLAVLLGLVIARLGWLLFRRQRRSPDEVVVEGGAFGAAVSGPAFLTFARHSKGLWAQRGVLMVADHGGVFLPMGPSIHFLFAFLQAVFVPTLRFADVSFDVGGTSPDAMADAARRHRGFVVGPDWTWNPRGRSLHREDLDGIVALERAPDAGRMDVFRQARPMTEAELRRKVVVASLMGVAASGTLLGIGVAGSAWTGNSEILVGFASFAGLVAVAFTIAVVAIRFGEGGP
ncbi:MAG: hypothetical protein KC621_07335 [Myxococcales bacterium]|nr:hypothetical protein [Myxococcales bacterium]